MAGRDGLLVDFDIALGRLLIGKWGRSLILVGLCGVGKTVLLDRMREAGGEGPVRVPAHRGA